MIFLVIFVFPLLAGPLVSLQGLRDISRSLKMTLGKPTQWRCAIYHKSVTDT
jgi:hypothetical protein